MINSRFKNLCLVFSFIGHEQNVSIVEEYDKIVISMVVKCYHQLHPLAYNGSFFCKKRDD
jgi:hypothetical protein